eukprot:992049-Pyramimonas_sp.AAC.1
MDPARARGQRHSACHSAVLSSTCRPIMQGGHPPFLAVSDVGISQRYKQRPMFVAHARVVPDVSEARAKNSQ